MEARKDPTIGGDLRSLHHSDVAPDGQPQEGSPPSDATEAAAVAADAALRARFLRFLNEFTRPGEDYPYYKAQVHMLKALNYFKLEVDFDDLKKTLMVDRNYLHLAFQIVNDHDSSQRWLKPAITDFIKNEVDIDNERLMREAEVLFINKPDSICMLKEHLGAKPVKKKISLLSEVIVEACTTHGRFSFLAVLRELLMKHRVHKSYGGTFQMSDIVVVNSNTCWFLLTPQLNAQASDKSSDLKRLWNIMEEEYFEGGSLPLYFEDLKSNLLNAAPEKEWFRLYLEFHPALMPSLARRNFLSELSHNIHGIDSMQTACPCPSIFGKRPPAVSITRDWRDDVQQGINQRMKKVYVEKNMKYENTYKSQLLYMRQLIKHIDRQCIVFEKTGPTTSLKHFDETELYASSMVPNVLPYFLKTLLESESCRNQPFFSGVFSSYQSSQKTKTDVPQQLFYA